MKKYRYNQTSYTYIIVLDMKFIQKGKPKSLREKKQHLSGTFNGPDGTKSCNQQYKTVYHSRRNGAHDFFNSCDTDVTL